ncbi:MAG: hypothetical protein ACJZ9G_05490 [Rhodospirillales bacterium]|nr:MAG: hypothetical protein CBB83_04285 [Rhodospirillaceae bacterium TMED23]|tara:strand:- start:81 stop:662 length:582 start_codon:yes stop_codon:yes gene_type:complete
MPRKINYTKKIVDALFILTPTMSWKDITMEKIAKVVKLNKMDLNKYFTSKISILIAYNNSLDQAIFVEFKKESENTLVNSRDQIFDIIMAKFDILNSKKDGIRHIFKKTFPVELVANPKSYLNLVKSMKLVLNLAGIKTNTPMGCIRVNILSGIFINSFISWLSDDSPDMSKTMASLDKGLRQAEALQSIVVR